MLDAGSSTWGRKFGIWERESGVGGLKTALEALFFFLPHPGLKSYKRCG
jgi:hypothetical protein